MLKRLVYQYPVATAMVVSFFLLLIRGRDRFQHAHLWAEDGTIYLQQAYSLGEKSLTNLMDGYYQVVPRVIAFLGSVFIPIEFIPRFIFLMSLVAHSVMISLFASHSYRWIISSTPLRIIIVLALCLAPGLHEILGNLANIATTTMLILGIISLKSLRAKFKLAELIICLLAIFTQGACILLLPVFALRLYLKIRDKYSQGDWWPEALILLAIILATYVNVHFGGSGHVPNSHQIGSYVATEIRLILSLFFMYPWAGDFTKEFMAIVLLPFFFPFVLRRIREIPNREKLVLVFAYAGLIGYPMLTFFVRNGAAAHYSSQLGVFTFSMHRYSFLLPAAGYIFWMFILFRTKGFFPDRRVLPLILTAVFSLLSLHRFFVDAYGTKLSWESSLPLLKKSEATGCPATVDLPIYPEGWGFKYTSPLSGVQCDPRKRK